MFVPFLVLVGCSTRGVGGHRSSSHYATDTKKYSHATMRPYRVRGVTYYPSVVKAGDTFSGMASWYGPDFHGKRTSNGERYNMWEMTAAHKTLPMNTIVEVTNKRNGKKVIVRINDRGPFVATRIIDLSKAAAKKIDMIATGTAPVKLRVLGFEQKGKKVVPTAKRLQHLSKKMSMAGRYALQIGSFTKINGAIYTQEKYDNTDGYKTVIKDMQTNNTRMFKVWLRGFRSEQEARAYKKQGKFKNAFIVRED
jgi:rare lipoprotein A